MTVAIHKEIKSFLVSLGLTDTEVSLYIAGLRFGPQTASELAKRTGIRRTTTYSALGALMEKGMTGLQGEARVSQYTMKDPELIDLDLIEKIDALKKRQLEFSNLLPLFENMTPQTARGASSAVYEGISGIKTVVDMALFATHREWKMIVPDQHFFLDSDSEYIEYFIAAKQKRGIQVRSLWDQSLVRKRPFGQTAFAFRDPRVLPPALASKFATSVILFDTKVAFITTRGEARAVLIDAAEVHATMAVLFDGLWSSAKPVPKQYCNGVT